MKILAYALLSAALMFPFISHAEYGKCQQTITNETTEDGYLRESPNGPMRILRSGETITRMVPCMLKNSATTQVTTVRSKPPMTSYCGSCNGMDNAACSGPTTAGGGCGGICFKCP